MHNFTWAALIVVGVLNAGAGYWNWVAKKHSPAKPWPKDDGWRRQ